MQKHLPADVEVREAFDGAAFARHRDMAHVLSGLVTETGCDQLVVAPHCAVEEDRRRTRQAGSRSSVTLAHAARK